MTRDADGLKRCHFCGTRIPFLAHGRRTYCHTGCRDNHERQRRQAAKPAKPAPKPPEPRKPPKNARRAISAPPPVFRPPDREIVALRALEARQASEIQPRRAASYRARSLAEAEAIAAVQDDHGAEMAQVRGECLTGGCSAATQGDSKAPRIDT
jgi:hypothetical protein